MLLSPPPLAVAALPSRPPPEARYPAVCRARGRPRQRHHAGRQHPTPSVALLQGLLSRLPKTGPPAHLRPHSPRLVAATPLSDPVAPGPFCATAGCSHDIPGVPPHGRHVSRHCLSPSTRCCQRPECPEWDAAAGMRVRVRMKKNEKSNTKDPRQRRRKGVPPAGFEPAAFRSLGDCYKTNAPYQPSSEGLTFSKKPAI